MGPTVAAKAQIIEIAKIIKNCVHGKKNVNGTSVNRTYYIVIVKPTRVPIKIPERELEITKINAS